MRILHIDTGDQMRGGQHQVMLLLRGLRAAGNELVLLARRSGPLAEAARLASFPVYPAGAVALWRLSPKAEIVHAHDARAHTLAALASRRPFVVSRRVVFPVRRSFASRWKYRRAARFLAVSRFAARELTAAGVREDRIDVVYDAVEECTPPTGWNPDFPAVALATADPQKGRNLVEEAARLSGIPVTFSNDLPRDLRRASLFIYASRSEGLGSAALLAMNLGVPVVASRVGGLPEAVIDGQSGLLVENTAAAFAAAMRAVRTEAGLAPRLIANGHRRIAECFTAGRLVEQTIAVYARALGH